MNDAHECEALEERRGVVEETRPHLVTADKRFVVMTPQSAGDKEGFSAC